MGGRLWSELRYRWRALFRRAELERELDDELRFHLDRETDKLRAGGLTTGEARRRARVAFGGVEAVKDQSRDGRGVRALERLGQDLRYALRALGRAPGLTLAVVLTLGLGIGINAAMFGVVDQLLFRNPAYLPQPDQVHRIYLHREGRQGLRTETTFEYARYLDLRRWTTSFSHFAAFSVRTLPVGTGTAARQEPVGTVSAELFDIFDPRPLLGRFFTAAEDSVPVGSTVAVLSWGYWQSHYGGARDALGQVLRIGTTDYTIIGVAPRGFEGVADGQSPGLFIPVTAYAGHEAYIRNRATYFTRYNWSWMDVIARRKPGVSTATASADLSQAYRKSYDAEREESPELAPPEVARPTALAGALLRERGPRASPETRVAAWVGGVALVVLLIACANVANLLLARAVRRRREVAVRLALGVSRGRLAAQLLTESLLLAGGGALAGLLLGTWGGRVLQALFLPDRPDLTALADRRTLLLTFALAALAGVLTGMAPLLQARRTDLTESLKSGARDGGYRRGRMRTALLLAQAALSAVLLVGAGLFVLSLRHIHAVPLGYDTRPVVYVYPEQRGTRLDDDAAAALRRRLREAAAALPEVQQAALGLTVPFWDTWVEDLSVPGIDSVQRLGSFTLQGASPEYFATVGTRILRGRGFTEADTRSAPRVAVVSQAMAATLWPGQEALGQCMKVEADSLPCTTVVGIAENIHQNSLIDDPSLHYYMPVAQYHPEAGVLFVRVRGEGADQVETLRRTLQALMPGDAYVRVTPMRDIVEPTMRSWQLGATMFTAFGGLALVLAAIGLYGVIAYDVAQRDHELGVRIALGARGRDIVRMVVGDGLRVALAGVLTGSLLALWAGGWLAPLLYEQSPRDPEVFLGVAAALLVVALLASTLPALRATRVDPNTALRSD